MIETVNGCVAGILLDGRAGHLDSSRGGDFGFGEVLDQAEYREPHQQRRDRGVFSFECGADREGFPPGGDARRGDYDCQRLCVCAGGIPAGLEVSECHGNLAGAGHTAAAHGSRDAGEHAAGSLSGGGDCGGEAHERDFFCEWAGFRGGDGGGDWWGWGGGVRQELAGESACPTTGLRRNTTQHHSSSRAGGGGEVRRLATPGFMGQDGEGDGFLGIGVEAVIGGGGDGDAVQEAGEVGHNLRVVHTPTAGNEVGGPGYGTLYTHSDGGGGEHGGGGDKVGQGCGGLAEARDELDAVLLAAGALGRLTAVVVVTQQIIEQRAVDVARCGDFAAAIAIQFAF